MIAAADARLVVEELETGRGRLAQIAERYPGLREESQQTLTQMCGGAVLPLFRHVQLRPGAQIREERVVSLTASPEYALSLARDAPGMVMTSAEFIHLVPTILRYDAPAGRVQIYVPVVIEALLRDRQVALSRMKIRVRHGGSMTGTEVVHEITRRGEHEVVADVSGLEPTSITFARTEDVYVARDWLRGEARTGAEAVERAEHGGRIFVDERDGKFVRSAAKEIARWDALFAQLEEFFRDPCEDAS